LSAKGYVGKKWVAETKVQTVGPAAAVLASADRSTISADGQDLSIIDISIVDDSGELVPFANNLVRFDLSGPGKIIGVGNGDPSSHEVDKAAERRAFNGFVQVIVQSAQKPGTIELTANSPTLKSAKIKIKTKADKSPQPVLP
jgi:beta-galactosidase